MPQDISLCHVLRTILFVKICNSNFVFSWEIDRLDQCAALTDEIKAEEFCRMYPERAQEGNQRYRVQNISLCLYRVQNISLCSSLPVSF